MNMSTPNSNEVGDYVLKRQIGSGSFATVWRAQHTVSKRIVAIKVIDNNEISSKMSKDKFIREIALAKLVDHPFIAKLFEIIETPNYTYLVMEYAENGSLLNYVNVNGRLTEMIARRYFSQLVSALEYLHEDKKIAHRDLKAENVLLDKYMNIRLIDFGLSNTFTEDDPELNTACGSPAYAAPEMVVGKPYTAMADIWSAGVLLYAMVVGELPFDDENVQNLLYKIAFTEPYYPKHLSPQLVDLLRKILSKDPSDRLTLKKIKEHPWFSQTEYSRFLKLKFSLDENWKANKIDKDIIDEIASLGFDSKKLTQSLLCNDYNRETATYTILTREKITEKIKLLMDDLNSTKPVIQYDDNSDNDGNPSLQFAAHENDVTTDGKLIRIPKSCVRKPSPRRLSIPKPNHNNNICTASPEQPKAKPRVLPHPRNESILYMKSYRMSVGDAVKSPMPVSKIPAPVRAIRRRSITLD